MGLAEERQALLNGVLAAPDDDAPRLVFADWLEDHGEPERAEFIRVQCEVAWLPERCTNPGCDGNPWGSTSGVKRGMCEMHRRRQSLEHRSAQLADAPLANGGERAGAAWASDVRTILPVQLAVDVRHEYTFRRGFVEDVSLPAWAFLDAAGRLFRASPIRAVVLVDRAPELVRPGRRLSNGRRAPWVWLRTETLDATPASIPSVLFQRLTGEAWRNPDRADYRYDYEAQAGLRAACVAFGREDAARG